MSGQGMGTKLPSSRRRTRLRPDCADVEDDLIIRMCNTFLNVDIFIKKCLAKLQSMPSTRSSCNHSYRVRMTRLGDGLRPPLTGLCETTEKMGCHFNASCEHTRVVYNPPLRSKIRVYRGVHYFLIFALNHRLARCRYEDLCIRLCF